MKPPSDRILYSLRKLLSLKSIVGTWNTWYQFINIAVSLKAIMFFSSAETVSERHITKGGEGVEPRQRTTRHLPCEATIYNLESHSLYKLFSISLQGGMGNMRFIMEQPALRKNRMKLTRTTAFQRCRHLVVAERATYKHQI